MRLASGIPFCRPKSFVPQKPWTAVLNPAPQEESVVETNWGPEFRGSWYKSDLLKKCIDSYLRQTFATALEPLLSAKRKHCLVTMRGCSWQRASSMWQNLRQDSTSEVAVGPNKALIYPNTLWIQHESSMNTVWYLCQVVRFCGERILHHRKAIHSFAIREKYSII